MMLLVISCASWIASYLWPGAGFSPFPNEIHEPHIDWIFISHGEIVFSGGLQYPDGVRIRFIGFKFYTRPNSTTQPRLIVVPFWFPMTLSVWLAIVGQIVCRTKPRNPSGFCLSCGYDLRATADRCPECGNIPDKPMEAHA